jgi:alkaline phosphatase
MKSSMHKLARILVILCITIVLTTVVSTGVMAAPNNQKSKASVKNVILLIADGAGFNTYLAADYYQYGRYGKQVYEKFPTRLAVSTYEYEWATYTEDGKTPLSFEMFGYDTNLAWSDFNYPRQTNPLNPAYINNSTDSASSATAMATGYKTRDGAVGVDVDGNPVPNIVDYAESVGKATGIVTSVPFSHATPAGFSAHNISRDNYAAIANQQIYESGLDVLMGCSAPDYGYNGEAGYAGNPKYAGGAATWADITDDFSVMGADANGDGTADAWTVIRDKEQFQQLAKGKAPNRLLGIPKVYQSLQYYRNPMYSPADAYVDPFIETVPSLSDMTKAALNVLDNNREGFFLMVEGGAVDWASHFNQPGRMIEEQIAFNDTVDSVCNWVQKNSNWGETLVIVTADHETGYVWGPGSDPAWEPIVNNGKGIMPGMAYYGDIGGFNWHTNSLVPLYAKGDAARLFNAQANEMDIVRGAYLDNTEIFSVIQSCLGDNGHGSGHGGGHGGGGHGGGGGIHRGWDNGSNNNDRNNDGRRNMPGHE